MQPIRYVPQTNFTIIYNPRCRLNRRSQEAVIKQVFGALYDQVHDIYPSPTKTKQRLDAAPNGN